MNLEIINPLGHAAGKNTQQLITLKNIFEHPKTNKYIVNVYYSFEEFETKKQAQEFLIQASTYINNVFDTINKLYAKIVYEIQPNYLTFTYREKRTYAETKKLIDEKFNGITTYAGQSNQFYYHAIIYIAEKINQIVKLVNDKPEINVESANTFLSSFLQKIELEKNKYIGIDLIGSGSKIFEDKITEGLNPIIKKYINYLNARNYSPNTIKTYTYSLLQYEKFLDENKLQILNASKLNVREYIVSLYDKGKNPKVINNHLKAINSLYKYCARNKMIVQSPSKDVPALKVKKTIIECKLTPDQIHETLDGISIKIPNEFRDRIVLEVLYGAGLRIEELINLKLINIKPDQLKILGKGNKERIIPISKNLSTLIRKFIKTWNHKTEFLIETNQGQKSYSHFISGIVWKYLKTNPHQLRHAYATVLLNNGAPLIAVSKLLGHASIYSTQIYTHITVTKINEDYQKAFLK